LDLLDEIVARSERGDRTSAAAADFWAEMITREGHPLATDLPDENLVDWHARGLIRDLHGVRALDIGCGNGRNSKWLADQGATVEGIDISEPLLNLVRHRMPPGVRLTPVDVLRDPLPVGPFNIVYDSGCFHHIAPHRRATYLERVQPLIEPGGVFGIVTLASGACDVITDAEMIVSGDTCGGTAFDLDDLQDIFSALQMVEGRRLRPGVEGTFAMDFLHAALFRSVG
jgi:2-polyprenyl-3-methyl-5-hydroxy-6-metoxy-1,4-benzoquinol methylase